MSLRGDLAGGAQDPEPGIWEHPDVDACHFSVPWAFEDEATERRAATRLIRCSLPSILRHTPEESDMAPRNVDNSFLATVVRVGEGVGACEVVCQRLRGRCSDQARSPTRGRPSIDSLGPTLVISLSPANARRLWQHFAVCPGMLCGWKVTGSPPKLKP